MNRFESLAPKALFFCLDTKETKNQVSREASLPNGPLPCKTGKPWLEPIAAKSLIGHCAANSPMPWQRASPASFYPFLAEAYLLTGKEKNS
jgi:hypothetical protein